MFPDELNGYDGVNDWNCVEGDHLDLAEESFNSLVGESHQFCQNQCSGNCCCIGPRGPQGPMG